MDVEQLRQFKPELSRFLKQFDDCFPRKDTRAHLPVYVRGQLSALDRKSVEPIAVEADVAPRTLQEFLSQHRWPEDWLRDRFQQLVRDEHSGPNSIGIIDETSFVKKGDKTPGGQAAMVRRRRQARELHCDSPPGLRPRRLPLLARWRIVPARGLGQGS